MTKKTIIWSSLAVLVTLGGVAYAWHYSGHHHCCGHGGKLTWMIHELKDELDLNDQQVQFLKETKKELFAHKKKLRSKKGPIFTELSDEIRKNSMNKNVLHQLAERVKKTHMISKKDLIIEKLVAFHAMLSAEQKEELADKLQEFADKHGEKSACCPSKHDD